MKLTSKQITQIKDQIDADPVPAESPAGQLLESHFGDHTFYVDEAGVHVFESDPEPQEADGDGSKDRVVPLRVASWTDEKKEALSPHDPIPGGTGVVIDAEE